MINYKIMLNYKPKIYTKYLKKTIINGVRQVIIIIK